MQKEKLRKLRTLTATKEMMAKANYVRYGRPEYEVLLRVQNLSGYIKVAVFFPKDMKKGIKTPRYEIFLNVEGEEYITRELDEKEKEVRWLSAMCRNLDGMPWISSWSTPRYYISSDGRYTLNKLRLEAKSQEKIKGINRLQQWQQEQKDKETKRKEDREQAPWDKDMALVPDLPKGFMEWMRKDVANEYYIIYDYAKNGAKTGYCSRCKRMVPISGAKHGTETICPACKARATFRASGRIKTLSTGDYYGEIIQKIDGGIVVRGHTQRQYYRDRHYSDPVIDTIEDERIMIFDNGVIKRYTWSSYKQKYMRWILDKNYIPGRRTHYWGIRIKLYRRNLTQLKKNTFLKHSSIDLWDKLPVPTVSYIEIEKGNPAVEMLAKLGMFRMAKDMIDSRYDEGLIDQHETELSKMLRIDKSRLKRLKEMDGNIFHLKWMQYEKTANTIWPDEMIKDFGNQRILSSDFGFLQVPISFVKCHNYLKKQASIMDESMHQALITWRDYVNMADSMKMDIKNDQILKPKDVKRAHDELVLLKQRDGLKKQAKQIEKKWPKVNKQLPKLKKFEFAQGDYCIVAPKNVLDIVEEGTILSHCVHTCDYYFSRIQTDESYLFFLRRSSQPDVPWYTLEVEPSGNIRQKRTTGDNQNADFKKAVKFLKKWQQFFKKQLTQEEVELGKKSNELRLENYTNLRKNGNRVWHGKLAGQLLADVLEADFMEVI